MFTEEEAAAPHGHGDEAGRARVEADGQEGGGSSRAEQAAAAPSGMETTQTRPGELAVRLADWKVGGGNDTVARGVQDDQAHPAAPSRTASR